MWLPDRVVYGRGGFLTGRCPGGAARGADALGRSPGARLRAAAPPLGNPTLQMISWDRSPGTPNRPTKPHLHPAIYSPLAPQVVRRTPRARGKITRVGLNGGAARSDVRADLLSEPRYFAEKAPVFCWARPAYCTAWRSSVYGTVTVRPEDPGRSAAGDRCLAGTSRNRARREFHVKRASIPGGGSMTGLGWQPCPTTPPRVPIPTQAPPVRVFRTRGRSVRGCSPRRSRSRRGRVRILTIAGRVTAPTRATYG
jgi:hypothetical protein